MAGRSPLATTQAKNGPLGPLLFQGYRAEDAKKKARPEV